MNIFFSFRIALLKSTQNDKYLNDIWFCNRGILARLNDRHEEVCFCPFYLYGDRCEFQRRRVTIPVQLFPSNFYSNEFVPLKLVYYLINTKTLEIVDYFQQIIVPYDLRMNAEVYQAGRLFAYLLFPVHSYDLSQSSHHFVRIDAFILNMKTLDRQASWYYDIPFPFLPVQRLVVQLILLKHIARSIGRCAHGELLPYENRQENWCRCEPGWSGKDCNQPDLICRSNPCYPGSICISVRGKPICLCTSNRFGPTCRIPTSHICYASKCQHKGTCLTLDVNADHEKYKFYCACQTGFTGQYCEKETARLHIQFERELIMKYQTLPVLAVRLNYLDVEGQLTDSYRRVLKNVQLEQPVPIFHRNRKLHKYDFAFVQLYTDTQHIFGQYFLIMSNNTGVLRVAEKYLAMHINASVETKNQCPYIDRLFDSAIVKQIPLQRAKFYQEPCQNYSSLACFHDENFMCICDRYRLSHCFAFAHRLMNCSYSHSCLNDGLCLQEDEIRNPLDYICICQECFFGDLCQYTTSQYSISLDALIGFVVISNRSIVDQSVIVQLSFAIISILFFVGLLLNTINIILFTTQENCRSTGCGYYILVSSILSMSCLAALALKFIALVFISELSTGLSCILIEYFLKCLPAMVDWTNVCILLDRVWSVRKGIHFNKTASKKLAKMIIPTVLVLVGLSLFHDPLHRQSIVDPRLDQGRRAWCMVQFSKYSIRLYNMAINISHYVMPFVMNVISTVIIFANLSRVKAVAKHQAYNRVLREQILAFKHLLIIPLVLVILALPRLVFAVLFTCISSSSFWQIRLLLASYFIGFLPQVGTFLIFVVPSKMYKNELVRLIEKLRH